MDALESCSQKRAHTPGPAWQDYATLSTCNTSANNTSTDSTPGYEQFPANCTTHAELELSFVDVLVSLMVQLDSWNFPLP